MTCGANLIPGHRTFKSRHTTQPIMAAPAISASVPAQAVEYFEASQQRHHPKTRQLDPEQYG